MKGPGRRQVLDKRYYEGLLQLKVRELTNEIAQLRKETENSNKERDVFIVYDKQNKELAKELTGKKRMNFNILVYCRTRVCLVRDAICET